MDKQAVRKKYQQEVNKLVHLIVKNYQPEKIIHFGSGAAGKTHEQSDIDLLIIKKTKARYWNRIKKVIKMCFADFWTPTDIFVLTPQEFQQAVKENRFFLVEEILPKGKVVYEKNPSLSQ